MSTALLKTELHQLVDQTENESLLRMLFDILQHAKTPKSINFWANLSDLEKKELLQSSRQADNDALLTPWEALIATY